MGVPIITPEDLREYIQDRLESNHLLDDNEFSVTRLNLAIELAISEFNGMTPLSSYDLYTFPNKALLVNGALYKAFFGQAALLARNTMEYSDGGLQIPVEERMALYTNLAQLLQEEFRTSARAWKIQDNIESGWGGISSDYARFPIW